MGKVTKWLSQNSLSLAFFALFIATLLGQSLAGWFAFDAQLTAHRRPVLGFWVYLGTGDFLEGIFVNWQAAILQLVSLILFAEFLWQKGAPHSRKGKKKSRGRARSRSSWIYRNSFLLAFLLLFSLSFLGHLFAASWVYNETQRWIGQRPLPVAAYLRSADFWARTLQTWEAEFVVLGIFLVLSIFLRQEGSAESKPVESGDAETGTTNQ